MGLQASLKKGAPGLKEVPSPESGLLPAEFSGATGWTENFPEEDMIPNAPTCARKSWELGKGQHSCMNICDSFLSNTQVLLFLSVLRNPWYQWMQEGAQCCQTARSYPYPLHAVISVYHNLIEPDCGISVIQDRTSSLLLWDKRAVPSPLTKLLVTALSSYTKRGTTKTIRSKCQWNPFFRRKATWLKAFFFFKVLAPIDLQQLKAIREELG